MASMSELGGQCVMVLCGDFSSLDWLHAVHDVTVTSDRTALCTLDSVFLELMPWHPQFNGFARKAYVPALHVNKLSAYQRDW